jgi:hypothetical protein
MDEVYPSMVIYNASINPVNIYFYGSVVIGICMLLTFLCVKEPKRFYRVMKRKNTDELPLSY